MEKINLKRVVNSKTPGIYIIKRNNIKLSEKLSFYKEIIDAQRSFVLYFYISSNYVRSILFCRDKHRDISQTRFHVCIKVHRGKKHVCERKTLFGQPNSKPDIWH